MLPCFAGDRDPLLERAGEEIAELREGQWLVMHNDDRHRPDVRAVIERMAALDRGPRGAVRRRAADRRRLTAPARRTKIGVAAGEPIWSPALREAKR